MDEVERALAAAAGAGPFFLLETEAPPTSSEGAPPWRRFVGLLAGDGILLRDRVGAVAQAVAERADLDVDRIDPRAAASLVHLGLAARLVSPPLACAVLGGAVPHLDPDALWWRDVLGPVPLTHPNLTVSRIGRDDAEAIAAASVAALSDGPVALLTDAVATLGVSRRVLWGNVASSFVAAASGILRFAPERREVMSAAVGRVFAAPPLAGQGTFDQGFTRTSCCLYYRVPGGGYCGDCVLA